MKRVSFLIHRNTKLKQLLISKKSLLSELNMLKQIKDALDSILTNELFLKSINNIYNLFTNCIVNYPEAVIPKQLDKQTIIDAVLNILFFYFFKGFNADALKKLTNQIHSTEKELVVVLEQLERFYSEHANYEKTILLEETKSKLTNLDYIKKGSIALYENDNNKYFRFTLCNTYISPSEPWDFYIKNGLIPSAYLQVKPLTGGPHFLLQPLTIIVNLDTSHIRIKKVKSTYQMHFLPHLHPHIEEKKFICLGNFEDYINKAIAEFDFLSLVSLIRIWAQTVTLADEWGYRFVHGFQHIFNVATGTTHVTIYDYNYDYNDIIIPNNRCSLTLDNEPIYFEEVAKGVYTIKIKDKLYTYDPHNIK